LKVDSSQKHDDKKHAGEFMTSILRESSCLAKSCFLRFDSDQEISHLPNHTSRGGN